MMYLGAPSVGNVGLGDDVGELVGVVKLDVGLEVVALETVLATALVRVIVLKLEVEPEMLVLDAGVSVCLLSN